MVDPIQSSHNEETKNNIHDEFKVTPWEVEGEIDYNKLIEKFGTQIITPDILKKVKDLIGEMHPMLKLQYFFSHRDFDWILSKYEKGDQFLSLYRQGTFRHGSYGSSNAMDFYKIPSRQI